MARLFGRCETPSVLEDLNSGPGADYGRDLETVETRNGTISPNSANGERGQDLAAQTAGSSHGPWQLANSPALNIALPNAYFDSLGIPRLTVPG